MDQESGNFGCTRYRRKCKIRAPCCDGIFDCRHCHNEAKSTMDIDPVDRHDIPRHLIKMVICSQCGTERDVQQDCISCGVSMGNYFCSKCKFFDDDLVMLLWSYFTVVFTDLGCVPPNWKPLLDAERGDTDPLTGSEFGGMPPDTVNPRIRYCRKCNHLKPPRCHHCSVCSRCVLKMDHHCVWVVNCVGALNYKYFLLFLFYTFLETTLMTLSLLPHFIAFFSDDEIPGTPSMLATTFLAFGKV